MRLSQGESTQPPALQDATAESWLLWAQCQGTIQKFATACINCSALRLRCPLAKVQLHPLNLKLSHQVSCETWVPKFPMLCPLKVRSWHLLLAQVVMEWYGIELGNQIFCISNSPRASKSGFYARHRTQGCATPQGLDPSADLCCPGKVCRGFPKICGGEILAKKKERGTIIERFEGTFWCKRKHHAK